MRNVFLGADSVFQNSIVMNSTLIWEAVRLLEKGGALRDVTDGQSAGQCHKAEDTQLPCLHGGQLPQPLAGRLWKCGVRQAFQDQHHADKGEQLLHAGHTTRRL